MPQGVLMSLQNGSAIYNIFYNNFYNQKEERVKNKFFTPQVCVCAAAQTLHYAQRATQK